jgi:UDP-N-acetylglucosamine--N-acetylmuramyl-(pentapeptide) pyrophosphoryl-undecaprenol N-acetylglucosamine transferase
LQALNRVDLLTMAQSARALARPRSAAAVADAIEEHVKPTTAKAAS